MCTCDVSWVLLTFCDKHLNFSKNSPLSTDKLLSPQREIFVSYNDRKLQFSYALHRHVALLCGEQLSFQVSIL
jgi:hypothetical protein